MKEFKGTQGEWQCRGNEYGYNTSVFTDNSQNKNPHRVICTSKVNDQEQSNANLQLTSAAPDMLKALLSLIDPLTGMVLDFIANDIGKEKAYAIEQAINKALTC